ncbi:hypothetical protein MKEN_01359100 [Mycena kentingensis (nom. inval.)]|nr:hypothetical protein MKEN_01359100 [Mycena kentingensis (nom. inval.)]
MLSEQARTHVGLLVERAPAGIGPIITSNISSLKIFILQLTFEALSCGLVVIAAIIALYSLTQKGLRDSRSRQALFALTTIMLAASTTHLALHTVSLILQVPGLVVGDDSSDPASLLTTLRIVQTGMRRTIYFISDAIVVWRAWAIWNDAPIARAILAFLLLGTLACSAAVFGMAIDTILHGTHYETIAQNFLGTFPLLITNFTATAFVGYKLWFYRRNLKKYLSCASQTTKVERVLILLLESGGIYCAFWVLLMVGDFGYFEPFEWEWFQPNISALYPTLIILLVAQRKMLGQEMFSHNPAQSLALVSMDISFETNPPSTFPSNAARRSWRPTSAVPSRLKHSDSGLNSSEDQDDEVPVDLDLRSDEAVEKR